MSRLSAVLRGVATVGVLAVGAGAAWWLIATEPEQDKATPARIVPRVTVQPLVSVDRPVTIEAFGTVMPSREVDLAVEVEGRVIAQHASLEPGGRVAANETLLEIDRSDYEIALAAAQAVLAQAEAELEIERGRVAVAAREWERFADSLATVTGEDRSSALALREPQLRRAEAVLASARNEVNDAQLQLERATLRAPFDAVILSESVDIGRQLTPGTTALQLAGVHTFWVVASVSLGLASRLPLDGRGADIDVIVYLDTGAFGRVARAGRFVRRLPDLENRGRMARVLVSIEDPLGLDDSDLAPIPIGSYVELSIPGGEISGVFESPRAAIRENDQVWVRDEEGRLRFRAVEVMWRDNDTVLMRGTFDAGDELIVSYLSDPLPGIVVEVRRDEGGVDAAAGEAVSDGATR